MSDTMILHSPITPGTSAPTDEADAPATTILDEETLRRIVAEVVREELQGALGERITRNIRKLVRREIRLVLASDEADCPRAPGRLFRAAGLKSRPTPPEFSYVPDP
jgi:hypothetical protein